MSVMGHYQTLSFGGAPFVAITMALWVEDLPSAQVKEFLAVIIGHKFIQTPKG